MTQMIHVAVQARMSELNMPLADVARESGVDRVTIDRFLTGDQSMGSHRLQKLLGTLGLGVTVTEPRQVRPPHPSK